MDDRILIIDYPTSMNLLTYVVFQVVKDKVSLKSIDKFKVKVDELKSKHISIDSTAGEFILVICKYSTIYAVCVVYKCLSMVGFGLFRHRVFMLLHLIHQELLGATIFVLISNIQANWCLD